MKILEEVEMVLAADLDTFILQRAKLIVSRTQGNDWNDPEDWQMAAIELAHAIVRKSRSQ